jgi:peptidoglycan/xylan/chitin deacetylase (PgdA/CDA1 family)
MRQAPALHLAATLLASACGGAPPDADAARAPDHSAAASFERTVAITIDDLPTVSTRLDIARQREITDGILATLRAADVPATGFVNEGKLYEDGRLDSARVALLRQWLAAGMELGNHTFSHGDLHEVPLADYQRDILRGEAVTRALVQQAGGRLRWFRHPFLHAGTSRETQRALASFLDEHGYRIAPVTVDNGDWIFARAYDLALDAGDSAAADSIARTYVTYMDTVAGFYEAQARVIVGYELPQVLLLHANRLNARSLDELIANLRRRGYAFVPLEEALRDSAYALPDEYTGPAGITWLHRWALTRGMPGSVFAGEPEVPAWISARAESR